MEKFRQKRIIKKRYFAALLLFVFLLVAGLLTVDYTTNHLLLDRRQIAMAAWNNQKSVIEITVMNKKIYVNTQYINRDLKNLREKFADLLKHYGIKL